ncbi:MAG: glutamate racemase [Chloroflexi bacterium]|nr:glutamate racemase [Chloroflexota bacterium]
MQGELTQHAARSTQHAARIGLFDSGVGGLSVAREIMRQLPGHPLIYLADQAHAPYGQRPLAEIRALSAWITRFLLDQGAEVIVIACNTASAAALRPLRAEVPGVSFVGMEPAVKPAAERSRSGHVGVIATSATFQGELFASLLDRFAGNVAVHTQVCPELVPLVEAGELASERTRQALTGYLAPLLAAGIDELVLGCTHYPFLRPLIEEVAGPGVEVLDPAPAVARQTARVLAQDAAAVVAGVQLLPQPAHRFYTTGAPARFQAALLNLLGIESEVASATWDGEGRLRICPQRATHEIRVHPCPT